MKYIMFSKEFPATHPRKGEPTGFVQKILWGIMISSGQAEAMNVKPATGLAVPPKYHTIRAGNRWKVGDQFSARVWEGKPYKSKQKEFVKLKVEKVWTIKMIPIEGFLGMFWLELRVNGKEFKDSDAIAANDGLTYQDFNDWFDNPQTIKFGFEGQIICWNSKINYV